MRISLVCIKLLFFAFVLSACEREPERPLEYVAMPDLLQRQELITRLKKANINIKVDNDGRVWYGMRDRKIVIKLLEEIRYEHRDIGIWFEDTATQKEFLAVLERQGIRYSITHRDGRAWIVWSRSDDDSVNKIIKKMKFFSPRSSLQTFLSKLNGPGSNISGFL